MKVATREIRTLTKLDRTWALCAICRRARKPGAIKAVWLGRTAFPREAAICVCLDCLRAAVELLERPPSARGTYARLWACPCGSKLYAAPKSAKARPCPNCGRVAWAAVS